MKAAWYERTGDARDVVTVGDQPLPEPKSGEVRVRLHASGVNPSDVKTRAGARGELQFPKVIPHSDGAGIVDAVGPDVDAGRLGQRVWIWNGAWARPFGTCAEYIVVPSAQAPILPDNTSFEAGACLGIPASTAWFGVFADGDVTGKTVLVTGGAGAVGHYAIQFAKLGGAKVITTVSGPEKAAHAKTAGPDLIVNYKEDDVVTAIRTFTGGEGVDRVVEVEFGGNLDVTNEVLAPNGVIATYGSMDDPTPTLPFYPMMFKGVTLRMYLIYLLSETDRQKTVEGINKLLESGKVTHAIANEFSIEDTAGAHLAVESGAVIGNIVVTID
ncbi:NADPH:quinone reductase [Kordiimonas sp.]|uniref:NADPH:quinone reductase n=1 Tax=Kordiimonas sp. TaxID=1970157 RepID=UPI003A92B1EE